MAHWRSHKTQCSPALGARAELSSKEGFAATVLQRLVTLHLPAMRYSLLAETTPEPVAGRVVVIDSEHQPNTVRLVSVDTARVLVKDVEHTRLAVQNGDVSMDHVVTAIETGLSMETIESEARLAFGSNRVSAVGCVGSGFERVTDERLCAYGNQEGAWLPALTVSIHKMTWVDEALAVAPLAKEQATFIAMAPDLQAACVPCPSAPGCRGCGCHGVVAFACTVA